ncbi:hypothetical protein SGPA1_30779 [Streptomyces misionensis JCM 4497]
MRPGRGPRLRAEPVARRVARPSLDSCGPAESKGTLCEQGPAHPGRGEDDRQPRSGGRRRGGRSRRDSPRRRRR